MNDELNLSNLKPAQQRKARKRVGRGAGAERSSNAPLARLASSMLATFSP